MKEKIDSIDDDLLLSATERTNIPEWANESDIRFVDFNQGSVDKLVKSEKSKKELEKCLSVFLKMMSDKHASHISGKEIKICVFGNTRHPRYIFAMEKK